MYKPRLLKGKAAPEDNYNKDIIFIFPPFYLFPRPPLYSPFPPLIFPPLFPPFPFPFLFPFPFPPLLPPFPPFLLLFLLGRSIYRPREINYNPTQSL